MPLRKTVDTMPQSLAPLYTDLQWLPYILILVVKLTISHLLCPAVVHTAAIWSWEQLLKTKRKWQIWFLTVLFCCSATSTSKTYKPTKYKHFVGLIYFDWQKRKEFKTIPVFSTHIFKSYPKRRMCLCRLFPQSRATSLVTDRWRGRRTWKGRE